MATAEVGAPLSVRIGLHGQCFSGSNFLVTGGARGGDQETRILGAITAAVTGPDRPVLRHLELSLSISGSRSDNVRADVGRTDPTTIATLGTLGVGVKAGGEVVRSLSVGGLVEGRFFTWTTGGPAPIESASATVTGLGSFDVGRLVPAVPLRFHLGLGIFLDNSLQLFPAGQCASSLGNDACIRSRVVETFAYGIAPPRLELALAVELGLHPRLPWGLVGIAPLVEVHLSNALGDGDVVVANALSRTFGPTEPLYRRDALFCTVGLRLRPGLGLIIDAAVDLGLTSPGYAYGPRVPDWNLVLGLGYALGKN
jgi:hypothetical protein